MKLQRRHKIIIIIAAIIFIGGSAALISYYHHADKSLKIFFLNVGQGDAMLIRTPAHQNILIDGGPDNSILTKLSYYLPWFCRRLDIVILTHPHADHLIGLIEVLKRYNIKKIIGTNLEYRDANYDAFLNIAKNKNIYLTPTYYGQTINLGQDCFLKILSPLTPDKINKFTNLNNASIVGQLDCEKIKTLFTGDIDNASAKKIYENNIDLNSDILKVSHHGSKEGNSFDFLSHINAKIAVIEVGAKNKFGHPNQESLDSLEKLATKIWRTDIDGDISFIIKNGLISIKN